MTTKKRSSTKSKSRAVKSQRPTKFSPLVIVAAVVITAAIVWGVVWVVMQSRGAGEASASKKYAAPPPMTIDVNKRYTATVKMAKGGEFAIQLYADKAPITVNNFIFLAREGYYDGTTFHRVLEGFMAQGGDPTGSGRGGPGYVFANEDSDLKFDRAGVVAMANAGRNTNGSQFFITFGPQERLNGGYTIFGQVIRGMNVVNGITRRDPEQNPDFRGDEIASITISEE